MTPAAHNKLVKLVRELRAERLRLALVARATPRASILAREDAIGAWWAARHDHLSRAAVLASATIEPKYSHLSPAARERAVARKVRK